MDEAILLAGGIVGLIAIGYGIDRLRDRWKAGKKHLCRWKSIQPAGSESSPIGRCIDCHAEILTPPQIEPPR